jgi:hypothetical protein
MADRFDVVAVRIEDECPVVARVVVGTKPGTTVVTPARRHGFFVEGVNGDAVLGSECDVEGLACLALPIQKSGLPRRPNPAAEALGSMSSS